MLVVLKQETYQIKNGYATSLAKLLLEHQKFEGAYVVTGTQIGRTVLRKPRFHVTRGFLPLKAQLTLHQQPEELQRNQVYLRFQDQGKPDRHVPFIKTRFRRYTLSAVVGFRQEGEKHIAELR